MEASAFDGTNVEQGFIELGRLMLAKGSRGWKEEGERVKDKEKEGGKQKKKCCKGN